MNDDMFRKVNEFMTECRKGILLRRHEEMPTRLFHYTSFDNLRYFFEPDVDLLATHIAVLNDKDEIRAGFRLFCDALVKEFGDTEAVMYLWECFSKSRTDTTRMPYVFSLSTDSNSLPQWRAYTDQREGGYAIGFDGNTIDNAVIGNMVGGSHYGWNEFLMPCVYTGNADLQFVIDRGIEVFSETFETYFKSNKPIEKRLLEGNLAVDVLVLLSSFIKNGGFETEREWRVVVKPGILETKFNDRTMYEQLGRITRLAQKSGNGFTEDENTSHLDVVKVSAEIFRGLWDSRVLILGGKPRVATRLKNLLIGISPLIAEIIVSPHGDTDRLMTVAAAMLKMAGLNFLPQQVSTIPYVCR